MGRILTTLALAAVVSSVLLIGAEFTPPASGQGPQPPAAPNLPMTVGQPPTTPLPATSPAADQGQQRVAAEPAADQGQPPATPLPAIKYTGPSGDPIVLPASQGLVIQLPTAARTLFVADSGIADVSLQSPVDILVTAKKAGGTALFAMDEAGNILLNKSIVVKGGVSIIRGAKEDTGAPPAGPIILQIPLSPAPR